MANALYYCNRKAMTDLEEKSLYQPSKKIIVNLETYHAN